MRILVTGGAGFIGSHISERLVRDGHDVVVLDNLLRGNKLTSYARDHVEFILGDVRNIEDVRRAMKSCDVVFHLAAILGVDVVADNHLETMDVEVIGTRNILNTALEQNVKKVLYASTSGIYGHSSIEKSVSEDVMVDSKTSYAMAKRFNEIYLLASYQERGIESVSLRFFNIYGLRQDERMVIPRFFEQALSGADLTVYGNGLQTRDFTYIDDAVEACMRLMEKSSGAQIVNIANENERTILDLANEIVQNDWLQLKSRHWLMYLTRGTILRLSVELAAQKSWRS